MGKIFLLFIFLFLLPVHICSQTFFVEENFDYGTGKLTDLSSWNENPNGNTDVQVTSGSLSYDKYPSSSAGNKIFLNGGSDRRSGVRRNFSTMLGIGKTVIASFLMEVTDLENLDDPDSDGDYFFNFQSLLSSNKAYIYIKRSETENKFRIGLAKSGPSDLIYSPVDLDIDTTHLLVISYSFQLLNDEVRLWINPELSGSEPSPDLSSTSGSDLVDVTYIRFIQKESSGNINIDGIRVSDSWQQAPMPVQLSSFTASVINNRILLNWRTATETNNFGFEVERQIPSSPEWSRIAFVKGSGNSNSEKEYEFTDNSVTSFGVFRYRLKQIDTEGMFEYSGVIEVIVRTPAEFELFQNYPNPFNPATNIQFIIPEDSFVKLEIFNATGERVNLLVSGDLPAGFYNYAWDASSLAGGVYFYKFQTGSFTDIKKMLLIK